MIKTGGFACRHVKGNKAKHEEKSCYRQKGNQRVCSDVRMPGDISMSFMSCAGRQKCMPTTLSGRLLPAAISVINKVEVLEAKIV